MTNTLPPGWNPPSNPPSDIRDIWLAIRDGSVFIAFCVAIPGSSPVWHDRLIFDSIISNDSVIGWHEVNKPIHPNKVQDNGNGN